MQITKKSILSAIVSILVLAAASPAFAAGFPDTKGHWAAGEIELMARQGVVGGYPDGNFYPEKNISRRELAKIVFSLFPAAAKIDAASVATLPDYPDIHQGWGQEYLQTGILFLPGYTDGYFKPDTPATRHEVALLALAATLAETGKYQLQNNQMLLQIPLPEKSAWEKMIKFREFTGLPEQYRKSTAYFKEDPGKNNFYEYASYFFSDLNPVALLVDQGILKGFTDGTLGLDREVTRAETVVILSRIQKANLSGAGKFLLEPAGRVYRPRTVAVDSNTAEAGLTRLGAFYQQKYADPLKRARMIYNLMIHIFNYDWNTREGLKNYTYAGIAGLMGSGLGTDKGLVQYYMTLAGKSGLKAEAASGTAVNAGDKGDHTWVELAIDGKTVPVDPTYGVCTGDVYFNNFDYWRTQGYEWTRNDP